MNPAEPSEAAPRAGRAYAPTERLAAILAAQAEFGTRESDLAGLMDAVAARAVQLLDAGGATVELVEGAHLVCRAAAGMAAPLQGARVELGKSPGWAAVHAGDAHRSPGAQHDPLADGARMAKLRARSALLAPLRHDGQVHGLLAAYAPDRDAFDDADALTLQLLANVVAHAMERWRQYKARHALLDERQLAQRRRKDAEARFDLLFHASPAPLVLLGDELEVLEPNDAFCRLVGQARDDLVFRHLPRLLHPDDAPAPGGEALPARLLRPDGAQVHARLRLHVLPEGRVLGVLEDAQAPLPAAPAPAAREAAPALAGVARVDVGALLAHALRAFHALAARNGVRVETRLAPGLHVRGDPTLLAYALRSLVENVLRSAPSHAHLLVQAGVHQGAIAVQLSGSALVPARLERLLPSGSAGALPVGRDGLGLEEAHRILAMHGGRLWWRASGSAAVLGLTLARG